jgi:exonuclease VII small subunit
MRGLRLISNQLNYNKTITIRTKRKELKRAMSDTPDKKSAKATKATKSPQPTYSELSAQLDECMTKLQNADTDIDEAAELYAAALKCITQMEAYLTETTAKVTKLRADFSAEG